MDGAAGSDISFPSFAFLCGNRPVLLPVANYAEKTRVAIAGFVRA